MGVNCFCSMESSSKTAYAVDNARDVWSVTCNGRASAKVFRIVWIQRRCQQLSTTQIPVWQNSIVPSDSCKAELNSAPSIRSTVAYQYCLLCTPFPRVQNRRPHREGERGKACGEQLLRSNGQRKRATCFALLQNELKSDVAHFTTQESNLSRSISGCVNTDFWLDKNTRDSRHTRGLRHLLQSKFALGR